jgi:hypothetical protein
MPGSFKIVGKDNLNRETVADRLLHSGIPDTPENRAKAEEYCSWINEFSCHDNGGTFFDVVDNDYHLSRGMEDLV